MGGAKNLGPEEFEKAVSEFYNGDTTKVHAVMLLASKARQGTQGMYLPRNPFKKQKGRSETPFDRFKKSLEDIGEGGVVPFLCERFPVMRVKIAQTIPGYADKLMLTPGDDVRVSSDLEKRLRNAVGKDNFQFAKSQLLRLMPEIPQDNSGQMVIAAMDLIIINHQINVQDILYDAEATKARMPDGTMDRKAAHTADIVDQKKQMQLRKEQLLKLLGLTSDAITKRGGITTGNLASAGDALKVIIGDKIGTADVLAEAADVHAREKRIEDGKQPENEIDDIDMAYLRAAAPTGDAPITNDDREPE